MIRNFAEIEKFIPPWWHATNWKIKNEINVWALEASMVERKWIQFFMHNRILRVETQSRLIETFYPMTLFSRSSHSKLTFSDLVLWTFPALNSSYNNFSLLIIIEKVIRPQFSHSLLLNVLPSRPLFSLSLSHSTPPTH